MSFDYSRLVATSDRLIARFGTTHTLRRYPSLAGAGYGETQGAPTDYTVTAVRRQNKVMDAAKTLVADTQESYLVRVAEGVTPAKDDFLVIDGAERRIVAVQTLAPGPTTINYMVWVDG